MICKYTKVLDYGNPYLFLVTEKETLRVELQSLETLGDRDGFNMCFLGVPLRLVSRDDKTFLASFTSGELRSENMLSLADL